MINSTHLKLMFGMYLQEIFLLSRRSWEVLCFKSKRKLQKVYTKKLTFCNSKIAFVSPVRAKTFFTSKDKLPKMILLVLVYRHKCSGYNVSSYGKTKHHFKVQICEHLGVSHLTRENMKTGNDKLTATQEYHLCCNYTPSFDNFSILTRESDFKLKIKHSILAARDNPVSFRAILI